MNIRPQDGAEDLRGALRCYNRAWRVGYRPFASADLIDAAVRSTEVPDDEEERPALRDEDLPEFRRYQKTVDEETGPYLVAERDDRIVGFVRARYADTDEFVSHLEGEIAELYVDPAHWREGVGSELLLTSLEELPGTKRGVSTAVLVDNDRARSFLESHGFEADETITDTVDGESVERVVYRADLDDVE